MADVDDGGGRFEAARRERVDHHASRARRWASQRIDVIEDHLPDPVADVAERMRDRDVMLFAGGLAFYSLVSVIPSLLLMAWITGSILGEERVERLAERLGELAPGEAAIDEFVRTVLDVGTGVGLIALAAAIWPATAFGGGLTRAFDALSVDEDPAMHGLRGRARALVVLAVLPVFVLGAFGTAWLSTALLGDGAAGTVAGWAVALVGGTTISGIGVAALFWWFGPADLTLRSLVWGAAFTATGIAIMSAGYLVYLEHGTDWEERVAGSGFAALVLLCLWLYLANLLLLAGYCVGLAVDEGEHRGDTDG